MSLTKQQVDANTAEMIKQINEALAAEGLEQHQIVNGIRNRTNGLTIELDSGCWSAFCHNYVRIYISVFDQKCRAKNTPMNIDWDGDKPAIDKKKFITKVKKQIEFAKQVDEFREAEAKQLKAKKGRETEIESQVEAAFGVEFSYGHCFLKDDLTLKLKDGRISIEGLFTPEETIEMIKKVLEMRS